LAYRRRAGDEGDWTAYQAVFRRAEPAHPERQLLRAVLKDGIQTFLQNVKATGRRSFSLHLQQREALAWIVSEERSGVFTFECICEMLGIEAGRLRAKVLARQPVE
jgi:hypothetical protein